jgi:hypothetical protein
MPTGSREVSAKTGPSEISDPMAAIGMLRSLRKGGMIVDAELLCTVIATMGTKSLTVLIFIFVLLFSKKLVSAIDSAMKISRMDISLSFR